VAGDGQLTTADLLGSLLIVMITNFLVAPVIRTGRWASRLRWSGGLRQSFMACSAKASLLVCPGRLAVPGGFAAQADSGGRVWWLELAEWVECWVGLTPDESRLVGDCRDCLEPAGSLAGDIREDDWLADDGLVGDSQDCPDNARVGVTRAGARDRVGG
jgi:hypothetical protein